MKDEIKEILDYLKNDNYFTESSEYEVSPYDLYKSLNSVQTDKLLDYITNLQKKYDKALETLVEYSMPCERDKFNLLDTDYCELNCSNDDEQFKKCWNKFIEWRLKDE